MSKSDVDLKNNSASRNEVENNQQVVAVGSLEKNKTNFSRSSCKVSDVESAKKHHRDKGHYKYGSYRNVDVSFNNVSNKKSYEKKRSHEDSYKTRKEHKRTRSSDVDDRKWSSKDLKSRKISRKSPKKYRTKPRTGSISPYSSDAAFYRRHRKKRCDSVSSNDGRKEHIRKKNIRRRRSLSVSSFENVAGSTGNIQIGGSGPEILGGAAAPKGIASLLKGDITLSNLCDEMDSASAAKFNKIVKEEVIKKVEEEVNRLFEQITKSDEFKKQLQEKLEAERVRYETVMKAEIELEKKKIVEEFKRKEEEEKRSKQQVEDILAANERLIKEEQKRTAEKQAKADEERLKELQKLQLNREEERRRKMQEDKEEAEKKAATLQNRQKLIFKMKTAGSSVLF